MKTEDADFPKVMIPFEHHQKMMAYVKACETEITGFFDVEFDRELNAFAVTKVYDLMEQRAGDAHVEIGEEAVSEFNLQLIKQGAERLPRGWWHSHVDMQTFLSAVDNDNIESLRNESFVVALVLNKDQKIFAAVKMFEPFDFNLDELEVEILYEDEKAVKKALREVKKKVLEPYVEQAAKVKVYRPSEFKDQKHIWPDEDYDPYDDGGPNDPYSPARGVSLNRQTGGRKTKWTKSFPRDREQALARIRALGLVKVWDGTMGWIYMDLTSGETWEDYWSVLQPDDVQEFTGDIKDADRD